jgi:hypothetical protein
VRKTQLPQYWSKNDNKKSIKTFQQELHRKTSMKISAVSAFAGLALLSPVVIEARSLRMDFTVVSVILGKALAK